MEGLLPLGLPGWPQLQQAVLDGALSQDRRGRLALLNHTAAGKRDPRHAAAVRAARGLILDVEAIARNERERAVAALPFRAVYDEAYLQARRPIRDVTIKLDGALAILYRADDGIHWAGRSRFDSPVARAASQLWQARHRSRSVPDELTLICELIHPLTSVLIKYDFEALLLIGAIDRTSGRDLPHSELAALGAELKVPVVERIELTLDDVLARVDRFTTEQEGYVIRLEDDARVKLSSPFYNAVYDLLRECTPWMISEVWSDHDDAEQLLFALPPAARAVVGPVFAQLSATRRLDGAPRADVAAAFRRQRADLNVPLCTLLADDV